MTSDGVFRNLTEQRVFRIQVPDITLEEAKANIAFVTRIELTAGAEFVGVLQIPHPVTELLGQIGGMLGTTLGYAYTERANAPKERRVYVTGLFPDRPFPWHGYALYEPGHLLCTHLGVSLHSGVPLFHTSVEMPGEEPDYESLERELEEAGYKVIAARPYETASKLVDFYRAHAEEERKKGGSPTVQEEDGRE